MRKYDALFVLTVMILLASTGLGTGVLLAADNKCITEPSVQSPQGSHWYYQTDRVNDRKCWYLVGPGMNISKAALPQTAASSKLKGVSHITRNMDARRVNSGQISNQSEARLNKAARDALFQEFLRWQARQKQSESPPADRDALFREFVLWEVLDAENER